MKNLTGSLKFNFKDQKEAFDYIYKEILKNIPIENWSFGGGTALSMFYFQHRASFDIDIFVNDPQYFTFLSPKFYLEESDFLQSNYIETANQISLRTKNNVKVDFLLNPPLTKKYAKKINFENKEFQVETIEEIIAKKIFYRNKDNKSRDILDIAIALDNNPNLINELINTNALNLDILYNFQKTLETKFDKDKFLADINLLEINEKTKKLVKYIPENIISNIDYVLFSKKNELKNIKKIKYKGLKHGNS
jgi:predicted nucleotidyltransferase component of viral defense system